MFEAVREFITSSFKTFEWEKQRTFHAINFLTRLNISLPVDLFWFQVIKTYKFLAEFVNNKICYGAFLSLTFFSECFLDKFYKILAKKACNYSMTLLLFRTVMQSCRFHLILRRGVECSSYQVSFPSLEVLLPFSKWILHPFKNL